jgi:hypothetical protein
MADNFLRAERDQPFLLPPDLRNWLPAGQLAWFVLEVLDQLDLAPIYRAHRDDGTATRLRPKTLLGVLLYAYCVGVRSARQIKRRLTEDIAFRVLGANHTPTTYPSPASASATSRPWPTSWSLRSSCAKPPACSALACGGAEGSAQTWKGPGETPQPLPALPVEERSVLQVEGQDSPRS